MTLALSIATYVICWWLIFFVILPLGIKTQEEAGDIKPGTPGSAPVNHRLPMKLLVTTLISGLFFASFYYAMQNNMISLEGIPFLPRFESAVVGR